MNFATFETRITNIKTNDPVEILIIQIIKDWISDHENNPEETSWEIPFDLLSNLIDETHEDGYNPKIPKTGTRSEATYPFTEPELMTFINTYLPEYKTE